MSIKVGDMVKWATIHNTKGNLYVASICGDGSYLLRDDTGTWIANIAEITKVTKPPETLITEKLTSSLDQAMSIGLRDNKEKTRWRNVPLFLFEDVIKVGQFGEKKYDTFNYMKGLSINDTLDALKRHLVKFESPYESDFDIGESEQNHLAHVAWNAIVALHMYKTRKDLDDRYKLPEDK